jgi:AcrR family transcriptional regulator
MKVIVNKGIGTRSRIISVAHNLFVNQGYHRTSMRQIAEKAGIAAGGIYNHFENKENIFETVFFEYHPYKEVLPILLESTNENIEQFIRDAAGHMVDVLHRRPDFLNLMFIEIVEFNNIHALDIIQNILPKGLESIRARLHFREKRLKQIPPVILIRTFIGLFFSYYMTDIILGPGRKIEFEGNAMDYFVDIYLHGILSGEQS